MIIQDSNMVYISSKFSDDILVFECEETSTEPTCKISAELWKKYHSIKHNGIVNNISDRIKLFTHPYIGGVIMTEEEVLQLVRFLKSHKCNSDYSTKEAKLVLEDVNVNKDLERKDWDKDLYELCIYSFLSKKEILLGKQYKCGMIYIDETSRKKLLRNIKDVVTSARERWKEQPEKEEETKEETREEGTREVLNADPNLSPDLFETVDPTEGEKNEN